MISQLNPEDTVDCDGIHVAPVRQAFRDCASRVACAAELRAGLAPYLRRREVVWLPATGLAADDVLRHAAAMRVLSHAFAHGEPHPEHSPSCLVLDWSSVEHVRAEAIAFAGVITCELQSRGLQVAVCMPACDDVRAALEDSRLQRVIGDCYWVPEPRVSGARARVPCPIGVFGGTAGRGGAASFVRNLAATLGQLDVPQVLADQLEALAIDLIQNVLAHANGARGAAAVSVEHRRRPPRIHLAVADAGPGLATSILTHERHTSLAPFSDLAIVRTTLAEALSGRASSNGGGGHGGGGGLTELLLELLTQDGTEVRIRSGTAFLVFRGEGGERQVRGETLTTGVGTQVRVTVQAGA